MPDHRSVFHTNIQLGIHVLLAKVTCIWFVIPSGGNSDCTRKFL